MSATAGRRSAGSTTPGTWVGVVAALCWGIALVGCTPDPTSRDTETEVTAATSETSAGADATWADQVGSDWDDMTFDELVTLEKQSWTELAQMHGVDDPPSVDVVRFVTEADFAATQVACIEDQGFAAEVMADGGVRLSEVPAEQVPALNEATYVCHAQYPVDPRLLQPLPLQPAQAYYDHLVASVSCVEGLGYEVGDPPSREVWLSQYYESSRWWSPFTDADPQSEQEVADLYTTCPKEPEGLYPPLPQP